MVEVYVEKREGGSVQLTTEKILICAGSTAVRLPGPGPPPPAPSPAPRTSWDHPHTLPEGEELGGPRARGPSLTSTQTPSIKGNILGHQMWCPTPT